MAATLVTGKTFVNGEEVTHDDLNNTVNLATISGIVNAEIASNAAIADSKLAAISTAGKVSGAALTSLANIPSGAGVIPAANLTSVAQKGANTDITSIAGLTTPLSVAQGGTGAANLNAIILYADTRIKMGTFNRALDAASGDVAITGVGFTPKLILFFGCKDASTLTTYFGASNGTNHYSVFNYSGISAGTEAKTTDSGCLVAVEATGKEQTAVVKTMDADGFTLTWTRTGATAAGTFGVGYIAFR